VNALPREAGFAGDPGGCDALVVCGEAAVAVRLFPRNQCRQLEVPSARAPPRLSLGRSPPRSPRFSPSSAPLKIVRGWPGEVDAPPPGRAAARSFRRGHRNRL